MTACKYTSAKRVIKIVSTVVLLTLLLSFNVPGENRVLTRNLTKRTYTVYFPKFSKHDPRILLYFPEDYQTSTKHYPVLYLNDGEFFYDSLSADFIIVCIKNKNMVERWNYLSPWTQDQMRNWWYDIPTTMGGRGDIYLNYIMRTKTWVDQAFRTLPDREHTAIGGFSMGGFFSVYASLKRSDIFSKAIVLSPAVWFGSRDARHWLTENNLIDFVKTAGNPNSVGFFFYVGGNEYHREGYPKIGGEYPEIYKAGTFALRNMLGGKLVYNESGLHLPYVFVGVLPKAITWLGW